MFNILIFLFQFLFHLVKKLTSHKFFSDDRCVSFYIKTTSSSSLWCRILVKKKILLRDRMRSTVHCVATTCSPVGGGNSILAGGGNPYLGWGYYYSGHGLPLSWGTHQGRTSTGMGYPLPHGQTDIWENIIFPILRMRAVKNDWGLSFSELYDLLRSVT